MRLLIQGINYAPDEIGIAKYNSEMAEWFAARGWQVRVVTAPPYYPRWSVPPGYHRLLYAWESRNGVDVVRSPLYVPRDPTGARRLLHLASYGIFSTPPAFAEFARAKPDAVIAIAPALMAAPGSAILARMSGAASFLHVQDFELDAAFQLGLLSGERGKSAMQIVERRIYRAFDAVSAPSLPMTERLVAKGCDPAGVFEFRNWADTDAIRPDVSGRSFREEHGIGPDEVLVLYSGNIAAKQGAPILLDMARALRKERGIKVVICGDGPARADLQAGAADLVDLHLLPLQPKERLPELLAAADIHVLPQLAGAEDLVLPSKLSGMLASGRPVVATVTPGSGIAREVGLGGVVVPPGDAVALAEAVRALASDSVRRAELGRTARLQAERNWSKGAILEGFERRVIAAIEQRKARSPTSREPDPPR